ncbi:hypothetical protein [Microcoleus sp. bin38.metabat.b11b12b14.051]|uniref:hypothetical protein n=1 Tax=Microcoleus sp. bin38.metabat.b11b12b14.051 TaxID=2742709 RepID=UPI0025E17161|nr:hypothetical protein [Microcoleus sp. bin38.metabat.b11b12b14.051]
MTCQGFVFSLALQPIALERDMIKPDRTIHSFQPLLTSDLTQKHQSCLPKVRSPDSISNYT